MAQALNVETLLAAGNWGKAGFPEMRKATPPVKVTHIEKRQEVHAKTVCLDGDRANEVFIMEWENWFPISQFELPAAETS